MTNLDSVLKSGDTILLPKSIKLKLWSLQSSRMDVRITPLRRLSTEEVMLLNCDAGEDS